MALVSRLSAKQKTALTILVAALGNFVDVFDIQLFAVLRVPSLQSLGLTPEQVTSAGATLLNWQMAGMLLGSIFWGAVGDKKGRIQVLFGSILIYSLGNIANAFVETIPAYAALRFLTGLGLAGEVGASITLASELMPKEIRGYATTLVAVCGVMGVCTAAIMGQALDWRYAYIGGGVLGLLLLAMRLSVHESGMFHNLRDKTHVARGRFLMFFTNRRRFERYLCCIAIAVPVWFVVGILGIFSPELGVALKTDVPLKASAAVISYGIGLGLGSPISGLISQYLGNRRKVLAFFLLGSLITSGFILTATGIKANAFYGLLTLDGFFVGYWIVFLGVTAEQFGTNLRTTATVTISNFVRASVIVMTLSLAALKPHFGFIASAEMVGLVCFVAALIAVWRLPETFARDLDFVER
jgi:MFS family permease